MAESEQFVDHTTCQSTGKTDDSRKHFKMHYHKWMYKLLGRIEIC